MAETYGIDFTTGERVYAVQILDGQEVSEGWLPAGTVVRDAMLGSIDHNGVQHVSGWVGESFYRMPLIAVPRGQQSNLRTPSGEYRW